MYIFIDVEKISFVVTKNWLKSFSLKKIFLDDSSYSITFKSFVALFSKCQCLSTSAAVLGIYKFEKNRM